jgi:hypothetical protein
VYISDVGVEVARMFARTLLPKEPWGFCYGPVST